MHLQLLYNFVTTNNHCITYLYKTLRSIKIHSTAILLLCLILNSAYSFGQNNLDATKDIKVGLVLSGGGAKGLAHIGALKLIEESGVRIDYIGGTSMGAIIGGLYASGYSANQLDSIFKKTNFNTLIQDNLPRSAKTFYEKEDAEKYALTLPFDGFKISFPSGLSKGQNVYNYMNKLTTHIGDLNDFSKLPIPFFCMATNIENGKQVLLEEGSLPLAISASGAIPSIFSPVAIEDQILTDGGVSNNYPIEELKKKGIDVIIGINVQDSLVDRKNLSSAFEILTQVNNFHFFNKFQTLLHLFIKQIFVKISIEKAYVLTVES